MSEDGIEPTLERDWSRKLGVAETVGGELPEEESVGLRLVAVTDEDAAELGEAVESLPASCWAAAAAAAAS